MQDARSKRQERVRAGTAGTMKKSETQKPPTALERLVGLLRSGKVHSLAGLAAELGTSPALVEAMLEDLVRRGYLREVPGACCTGQCRGCALSDTCAVGAPGRAWEWEDPSERLTRS